ncbi:MULTISPECIES: DNA mismatch repair endonuclease MutL [Heyndrickxia]|uniref:DNA mismatch repair endonuclease MutL n=1 Tax=Heyndrickxia TaxID=2837504 RepID=UPI002E1C03EC|nr:DNA mismatch repair endonuclease MutL [Weizmannia sp. CD-2023]MED4892086.1 DNA mismatch repair endonuclease MutL [Weizmannia sp. CD-2023]
MGKIAQLDESLSNRIAAGEVVERPASVVKELAENAIDAESTVIEIDVWEAGMEKIRMIDNGTGIEPEDVELAFSRHATSKIKNEHDLFRIRSLGFRGEALPSIAAVARVEMVTSTGNGPGTKAVIEGGKWVAREQAPSRRGTEITVTDLFFNTPARLKYMKSIHTELGNITDVVNRLALSHPEVSFRLRHGGKMLLQTSGNGDVRQVLAAIYGVNIAKKMIPVHSQTLDFEINGFIALPEITRASRNYISTMVNGRFIKNYALVKAILEGYHTLLPIGRYPIVLLSLKMDPVLVDANVHPAKLEVRFSKEKELCRAITGAIKVAFKKQELIPSGMVRQAEKPKQEQVSFQLDHLPEKTEPEIPKAFSAPVAPHPSPWPEEAETGPRYESPDAEPHRSAAQPAADFPAFSGRNPDPALPVEIREPVRDALDVKEAKGQMAAQQPASRIPPMYPIGQMHGTYIFAQNENGLYIIDQHAAQERVKYEFFREKVGEVKKEVQEMLVPLTLEYATDEAIKIQENLEALKEVGVFLEPFGHNSFIVRSHPTWFPKNEEKEVIEEMIEHVLSIKKVDVKKLREKAAIMMSCRGSIKANRHLRNDEIQALLDALRMASDPFTCPHGRPIIIHYSVYELEKMFKRVM